MVNVLPSRPVPCCPAFSREAWRWVPPQSCLPPPSLPQVEARLGQALDVLAALRAEGRQFDLVFLDADKKKYVQYYEALLGVGGLWGGLW